MDYIYFSQRTEYPVQYLHLCKMSEEQSPDTCYAMLDFSQFKSKQNYPEGRKEAQQLTLNVQNLTDQSSTERAVEVRTSANGALATGRIDKGSSKAIQTEEVNSRKLISLQVSMLQ